jgi:hypothetical protein
MVKNQTIIEFKFNEVNVTLKQLSYIKYITNLVEMNRNVKNFHIPQKNKQKRQKIL